MRAPLAVMALSAAAQGHVYLYESFDNDDFESTWVSPDNSDLGSFATSAGKYQLSKDDLGLKTQQDARFYMAARNFEAFDNEGKTMVVQLSVKHEQKIDCGGGYVKVYPPGVNLKELNGESPYNIMFGPDICGSSKKMTHVILSNGDENHLVEKKIPCETDTRSHAYTLILRPDNTYSVLIDNVEKESGTLADDWKILAPRTIPDPAESEPEDWVKSARIDDPDDVKPADWDDVPQMIADPDAADEPEDWDTEEDGEYDVPQVPNPEYKGEWRPKRIDNPDYIGQWEHPHIPNPEFEDDDSLYRYTSGAIGIDLWQVKAGSIFDDILITDDVEYAAEIANKAIDRAAAEKELEDAARAAERDEEMSEQDVFFAPQDDDEQVEDEELADEMEDEL